MLQLREIQQAFADGVIEGTYHAVAGRSIQEIRPYEVWRSTAG